MIPSKKIFMTLIFIVLIKLKLYAQSTDLSIFTPVSIPTNSSFEWHDNLPISSANKLSNTVVVVGLYYGIFKDASNCYSAATPIKVRANTCESEYIDLRTNVDTTAKPMGSFLSVHTGNPATLTNKIATNRISSLKDGTYFTAYYFPSTMCFSETSPIVVINIYGKPPICCPALLTLPVTLIRN